MFVPGFSEALLPRMMQSTQTRNITQSTLAAHLYSVPHNNRRFLFKSNQNTSFSRRDVQNQIKKAPARNAPQRDQRGEAPSKPNNSSTTSLQDGFPTTIQCFLFNSYSSSMHYKPRKSYQWRSFCFSIMDHKNFQCILYYIDKDKTKLRIIFISE